MTKRYLHTNSGLLLPNAEIAGGVRNLVYPDSRRFMGRRGRDCYCPGCVIFADDFAADDLATAWNQRSGSWSISSGVLSTSSSNAVLTCNTGYPGGGFHNHVIEVSLKASTGNRSRIIFSYNAGAYNYVEVYWNGASSIVYIKTSAGATIATSVSQSFTNGTSYTFRVCVTATSAIVIWGASSALSGTATSSTTTVGLGTGTTSAALTFDGFSFEKHHSDNSTCKSCGAPPCGGCLLSAPALVYASFENVHDGSVGSCIESCRLFNTTLFECVYNYTGSTSVSCNWRASLPGLSCAAGWIGVDITLYKISSVQAELFVVPHVGGNYGFLKDIDIPSGCYESIVGDVPLYINTATTYCDFADATCHIDI
jgi:hypothetical protein